MINNCANYQGTSGEFRGYFEVERGQRNQQGTATGKAHHGNSKLTESDHGDDDDEQEQSQFDSQEMEALVDGNTYVASKRLKYQKVCLQSFENASSTSKVQGEFMYTDPWWEVTVKIKHWNGRNYQQIEGPPKYRLRSDEKLDQEGSGSVIYQFLNKCGVEDEAKINFMQYLRSEAKKRGEKVDFALLRDVIDTAEEIEDSGKKEMVCNLVKKRLCKSVHYHIVTNAMDFPFLLEHFPVLLHKHLPSLLEGAASCFQLKDLEEILREKPYLFGFSWPILKETNLHLPEVHYDTFEKAGYLQRLDPTIKSALFVYCALKEKCARYGHTYCWLSTKFSLKHYVPKNRNKRVMDVVPSHHQREKLLKFLQGDAIRAIVIDEGVNRETCYGNGMKDRRVFVSRYYWAEINIATSVKKLMNEKQEFDKCGRCKDCVDEKRMKGELDESDVETSANGIEEEVSDIDKSGNVCSDEASTCCDSLLLGPDKISSDTLRSQGHGQSVTMSEANTDTASLTVETDLETNWQQEMLTRRAKRDQMNFKDDMDQHAAAKSIRKNPFSLIIGRGGCGKTHVVCEVMKEYCGASIVMAAPTGKAASNLRKKYEAQKTGPDVKARTLHQIIFSYGACEEKDKWDFRDTEILVVDECSMVSVVLLSRVLKLLMEESNLKKVILMGDYRQLPAIDCGNLLEDLYGYFIDDDICVELKTNHRAESEHIVNCAIKISDQEMPDLNGSEEFCHIDLEIHASVERQKQILRELSEGDAMDHEKSQFVAYTRNDCKALNDWCCPLYAGHKHMADDGKAYLFLEGDKICPTRNAYATDIDKKKKYAREKMMEEREMRKKNAEGGMVDGNDGVKKTKEKYPPPYARRICNGEIFFIRKNT